MTRSDFARQLGGSMNDEVESVVLEERDPIAWRKAFTRAVGGRGPVFLANPDWGERERAEFLNLVGQLPMDWDPQSGWLMIPTGGSSGAIKLARHDHLSLTAAVAGYTRFFGESKSAAVGVLPLHHVGGLMGWLRCALSGGEFFDASWARLRAGEFGNVAGEGKTISLVPTQLMTLLHSGPGRTWLRQFSRVLIGGAALTEQLCDRARAANIQVIRSYGATETAAMIAAQRAEGLTAFPNVEVTIATDGQVIVRGSAVCRGYWPEPVDTRGTWESRDLGTWSGQHTFKILGRSDDLIITGGEKVNPLEVEQVLKTLVGDERVAVVGVPDVKWGQRVVVLHPRAVGLDLEVLKEAGMRDLAAFKWPKQAIACDVWPSNALGKLDRAALRRLAAVAS
jgi:o-succinylbenzoate---CoA ligase